MLFAASRVRNSAANPRDEEMPELASVRSRACDDVNDAARTRLAKADCLQSIEQGWQITPAYPADDKILLHGGANRLTRKPPGDVSQGPELRGGDIAQGKGHRRDNVSVLLLRTNVGLQPSLKLFGTACRALGSPVPEVVQLP